MTEHEKEIIKRAMKLYGFERQLGMLVEEAAEVIQAVMKYLNKRVTSPEALISEIADISNMVDQMGLVWGEEIAKVKSEKLLRLEEKINDDEGLQ